jgi:hypothetical protein
MVEPTNSIPSHPYADSVVSYAQFENALSDWGTIRSNSYEINRPKLWDMQTISAYLNQGSGGSEGASALSFINTIPAGTPIINNFSEITSESDSFISDDLVTVLYNILINVTSDTTKMTQGLSSGNDMFSAVLDLLNSKE